MRPPFSTCDGGSMSRTAARLSAGRIPARAYVSTGRQTLPIPHPDRQGRPACRQGVQFETAARCWGLQEGQPVVVYDDWNRAGSARAWWRLTAARIPGVRILDGGLAAWKAVGRELSMPGPVIRETG